MAKKRRKIAELVSNTAPKAPVSPDVTLGDQGTEAIPNTSADPEMSKQASKLGETIIKEKNGVDRYYRSRKTQAPYISPEQAPYTGIRKIMDAESDEDEKKITFSPKVDGVLDEGSGNVEAIQGQSLLGAIKPSPEAKVQAQMQNDNTGTVLSNAILNNGTTAFLEKRKANFTGK